MPNPPDQDHDATGSYGDSLPDGHVALAPTQTGSADPLVGMMVAGRYTIASLLGRGAMGAVYRALHHELGHSVAIKVCRATSEDAGQRFLREARICASLRHPNSVRVHDHGLLPDGRPFLIMELLEGRGLDELIAADAPLSPARAAHIGSQIARALREAHAAGVVHRDLKPSNVFIRDVHGEPDFVKVVDFGIAKATTDSDTTLTAEGAFLGTPAYAAPEQLQGVGGAGPSVDWYALGLVLYELLTGKRPYANAGSLQALMARRQTGPPPSVSDERLADDDGSLAALDRVIRRLLVADPGARLTNADAVVAALDDVAGGRSSTARAALTRRRRWALRVLPALAMVVSLALLAWALWGSQSSTAPATASPALESAISAFYAAELGVAERALRAELERDPENARARFYLILVIGHAGRTPEVFLQLERIGTRLDELEPLERASIQLYRTVEGGGDPSAAIDAFRRDHGETWLGRVTLGMLSSELETGPTARAGIDDYRAAARLAPERALAHVGLASALLAVGELDEAGRVLRDAEEHHAQNVMLRTARGRLRLAEGDPDGAREAARAALDLDPALLDARLVALNAALLAGDGAAYDAALERLLGESERVVDRLNVVTQHTGTLSGQGRLDAAHALAERGIEIAEAARRPGDALRLAGTLADVLMFAGRRAELGTADAVFGRHLGEPELTISERQFWLVARQRRLVVWRLAVGDLAGAKDALGRLEAVDEVQFAWFAKDVALAYSRALVLAAEGQIDAAVEALQAAPHACLRHAEAGRLLAEAGRAEAAAAALEPLLAEPVECLRNFYGNPLPGHLTPLYASALKLRARLHDEAGEVAAATARRADLERLWPRADEGMPP